MLVLKNPSELSTAHVTLWPQSGAYSWLARGTSALTMANVVCNQTPRKCQPITATGSALWEVKTYSLANN